jgi:hypothetical protein
MNQNNKVAKALENHVHNQGCSIGVPWVDDHDDIELKGGEAEW